MKKSEQSEIAPNRYEIDVVPNEQGGYYARIPDFSTIFTGGQTPGWRCATPSRRSG